MKLSDLQKFILLQSYGKVKRINRNLFNKFYNSHGKASKEHHIKIITKSLERLIDRGLIIGYGEKTMNKWYIKEVQLTPLGRRFAKKLMGVQISLPFKKNPKS
ncbi:hypothetical protein KKF32_04305 [Patescibacteria group bacterium]|nr:hypothetical protein [Patescibacteria group bacterium]